jgi:hypothetical protein|uniref:Uncharacterized protein n=1 Tax=Calcidiscus leptoporus TaxID=127549 RepID=A0A7S0NWR7_9EUKA|mmetsp:Transcript_35978/g.84027  ORF Transcript_35978/g.84027 Transcript_35978/m.84027 type:complete len:132 (+) Transcript_35978:29-424(+)|eukprot:CAMPEP_0119397436 /NCGR_PEP_ID=MMETSP1334-20130426/140334_1 /TAXON_ID=127549 /ORGANISM="Calcidiscus leptoporus, Strain RCC1130" /LENGTH=131 /DNA_ID=CAMNT_0007421277 /DNA_START=29 /DNA_END=424 /DNA_ORIENTATION=-
MRVSLVLLCLPAALALMTGASTAVAVPFVLRATTPAMKKCAGGGVESSKKKYRRTMRNAVYLADTPEKLTGEIFTAATEARLLRMNWRVRHSLGKKIVKQAAALGVELPQGFAALDHRPLSAPPHLLKPSM